MSMMSEERRRKQKAEGRRQKAEDGIQNSEFRIQKSEVRSQNSEVRIQKTDPSAQVFSEEASGRIRFAVNPIVLQELLLATDAGDRPGLERIRDHLRVLPVDIAKAEAGSYSRRTCPSTPSCVGACLAQSAKGAPTLFPEFWFLTSGF